MRFLDWLGGVFRRPSPVPHGPWPGFGDYVTAIVATHNEVRARAQLPPLTRNVKLDGAAQAQADVMAERGRLAHTLDLESRLNSAGYPFTVAGENIFAGDVLPAEVVGLWLNHPPHARNVLGPWAEIGVGAARGADGFDYWCCVYGSPR